MEDSNEQAQTRFSCIGAIIMATVLTVAIPTALAGRNPTATIIGQDVITTNVGHEVVNRALDMAHETLKPSIKTQGDKSYSISSQQWKSGNSPQSTEFELVRSVKQFDDVQGQPITIETIEGRDMRTLIFVRYSGKGGALAVTNAIAAGLKKQGVSISL